MHTRVLMLGESPFHVSVDIDSMLLAVPIRSDTCPQILDVWLCTYRFIQIGWQPIPPQAVITAEVMLPHTVGVMVAFQLLILKNTLVIALLDLPLNLIELNPVLQILQTAAVGCIFKAHNSGTT